MHVLAAGKPGEVAIMLLHGMKFQAETWRQLGTLAFLAGQGFNAVALDLPGFGASPASPAQPAEVLLAVITALGLEKPVLLGPSMGGRVCLEFCLDHQEQVGALILVGPVGIAENRDRLATIKARMLAVWGGADVVSPPDQGRILAREIDNCRLVVFEGAPHPCYLAHPERFHAEINDFLSGL